MCASSRLPGRLYGGVTWHDIRHARSPLTAVQGVWGRPHYVVKRSVTVVGRRNRWRLAGERGRTWWGRHGGGGWGHYQLGSCTSTLMLLPTQNNATCQRPRAAARTGRTLATRAQPDFHISTALESCNLYIVHISSKSVSHTQLHAGCARSRVLRP